MKMLPKIGVALLCTLLAAGATADFGQGVNYNNNNGNGQSVSQGYYDNTRNGQYNAGNGGGDTGYYGRNTNNGRVGQTFDEEDGFGGAREAGPYDQVGIAPVLKQQQQPRPSGNTQLGQGFQSSSRNDGGYYGRGYDEPKPGVGQPLGQRRDKRHEGHEGHDHESHESHRRLVRSPNLGQGAQPSLGQNTQPSLGQSKEQSLGQNVQSVLGQSQSELGQQQQSLGQGGQSLGQNTQQGLGQSRARRYVEREPYRKSCNSFYGKYICYRLYNDDAAIPTDFTCWSTYVGKKNCTETENVLYLDRRNVEVDASELEGLERRFYTDDDGENTGVYRHDSRAGNARRDHNYRARADEDDEFGAVEKGMHNRRGNDRSLPRDPLDRSR